jgi:hypothetical protein
MSLPVVQRLTITMISPRRPGFYWVRFTWGWEPAQWTGTDWLRAGIEESWNDQVVEVGPELVKPDGYPA